MRSLSLGLAALLAAAIAPNAGAAFIPGTFEDGVPAGSAIYTPGQTITGFTFSGNAGIVGNGSPFGNPPAPQGVNAAFLQTNANQGPTPGSITQTFTGMIGLFNLSFFDAVRAGNTGAQITITVDNPATSGFTTTINPANTNYAQVTFGSLNLNGNDTITITSSAASGDNTVFIDNVTFTAVPEPASLAMLGLGLAATGLVARRARRKIA